MGAWRSAAAVLLAAGTATSAFADPVVGTIQGVVTLSGRPLAGVDLAFVDVRSGAVHRATSGANGSFEARVGPGQYVVTTENRAGLVVSKAPSLVPVASGRVASANVDLLALPSAVLQDPPSQGPPRGAPAAPPPSLTAPTNPQSPPSTPQAGATINFDQVRCFVAGEFPLLDAGIEPLTNVARARVYFKAAQGSSFYYVEMAQETGRFWGKLPRPKVEASPITYYLQATTTEFEESQTAEVEALVVEKKEECGERKIAAFGPPGEVTVFSAATGASIAPVGFAAGGAALAGGTVAAVVGGAAAAGIGGAIVVNPQPTPGPVATPTPQPTPIATPTPVPTATPSVPTATPTT